MRTQITKGVHNVEWMDRQHHSSGSDLALRRAHCVCANAASDKIDSDAIALVKIDFDSFYQTNTIILFSTTIPKTISSRLQFSLSLLSSRGISFLAASYHKKGNNLNKRITRAKKSLTQKPANQELMDKVHMLEHQRSVNRIATYEPEPLIIDERSSLPHVQHEEFQSSC